VGKHGGYGYIPDTPDDRDHAWHETEAGKLALAAPLPPSVSLRHACPPVYNQGQLGSCTGNGVAGALEFEQIRQGEPRVTPSRLFIYYEERVIEDTVMDDSGAQIRDGLKVVATKGAPPETDWPYNTARFAQKPPASAYADAAKHKAIKYARVQPDLNHIKAALAAGTPVVFGMPVYESFESEEVAETGIVPMPEPGEEILGGHCMVLTGYSDHTRRLGDRNSWGTSWGSGGYCTLPYEMVSMFSDLWTISRVS